MKANQISSDEFRERIDRLRAELGCNVTDIAKEIGISRDVYYNAYNDKRKISYKTLTKLKAAEERAGILPQIEAPQGSEQYRFIANQLRALADLLEGGLRNG